MPTPPSRNADFISGVDYSQFSQLGRFVTATVSTNQIAANGNEQFELSEDEDFVDSIETIPEDQKLPKRARIISIKVDIPGSSTDSDIEVYQSENFNPIEQVIRIENVSQADTPENYMLSGTLGTPFINKEDENQIHIEIDEKSNNATEYDIELNWLSIHT